MLKRNIETYKIEWTTTADNLIELTKKYISDSSKIYDYISNLKQSEICYESIINVLQDEYAIMNYFYNTSSFLQYVIEDDDIRQASITCSKLLNEYFILINSRMDVYNKILVYYNGITNNDKFKNKYPEDYKFIKKIINNYKRNGIELDEINKKLLNEISVKITDLETDFSNNLNEENTVVLFKKDELKGLSSDFLDKLNVSGDENKIVDNYVNDKYNVNLKYSTYNPCMKRVENEETRKKLEYLFNTRCLNENIKILIELLPLRNKKAELLGYNNHLEYITSNLMAKNGKNVNDMIDQIIEKTNSAIKSDINELKKIKSNKLKTNIDDTQIFPHDLQYYQELLEKQNYDVDKNKLREYFPINHVIDTIFNIYQQLFELKFEESDKPIWHSSVKAYAMHEDEKFIGTFYLDLFPRMNKYGHAACFPLQPACSLSNKELIYPISAIVCNFSEPSKEFPSLLDYSEVITFFHEFGHVIHQLLGRTKFSLFSGSSTEMDFVEAPSQMLENWCWEKESIKMLSKHYVSGNPIDDTTIDNLIKSKNILNGLHLRKQLYLTKFDLQVHSDKKIISVLEDSNIDIKKKASTLYKLSKNIHQNMTSIIPTSNTFQPASFGHIAGGYDAQYYSYLWSIIYASDMFYEKFKGNLFNAKIGKEYKNNVLKKGGVLTGDKLFKNFVGRKVDITHFLISKELIDEENLYVLTSE
jgi:thimet oligopeptidase